MENTNEGQGGPNIYGVYKLLKKTRTRSGREIRNSYTINEEGTKIIIKTIKKRRFNELRKRYRN